MAASGVILMTFVLVHMYGNLKAFQGQEAFNVYAHHLRDMGEPYLPREGLLWILRVSLILAVIGHIAAATALWRRARKARTTQYVMKKNLSSSASKNTRNPLRRNIRRHDNWPRHRLLAEDYFQDLSFYRPLR